MKPILEVVNIEKYYGGKTSVTKALDDISFTVHEGEFIGVMGPSGSGKTTLLNMIATIDEVSAGHIYLDSQDLTEIPPKRMAQFRRENLGFVFQDFNLLDTLTIGENIALALTINQYKDTEIDERVQQMAKRLGISELVDKYPYEISGGQKQRTACARALVTSPKLILADEPTGALDSKSSQILLETLSDLNRQLKATILMVTHDPYAASYCSRILFIKDGKLFTEMIRGEQPRKVFFSRILDTIALLGGEITTHVH
ncbi:multidrug ABC transporter ATP-binding protein [Paenibacillus sp. PK3_47]|uniref:ABC transporter ATP-binding protein n=1 Tax=Paenibacillus sp. PK3_47 TaxID=2072642 RepID=UPI00201E0D92|nr:ABC transporter ATP-binding protein [Paenibacillus sp. PK3_47]UQZ32800.1 multidrug ABC transporter ATP-binding protein [Paenibacillus sp. PK3_47]